MRAWVKYSILPQTKNVPHMLIGVSTMAQVRGPATDWKNVPNRGWLQQLCVIERDSACSEN